HVMTGKLADHFFLSDRGVIAEGKRGDICVFNLEEIARQPMEKAHDVPDGKGSNTWRFTRKPMPSRLTLVNGTPTFENGAYTGATPGLFLSPINENDQMAVAAE
ncbi:MAG: D-aminoacylase, partial [Chakrabartia godavariana]